MFKLEKIALTLLVFMALFYTSSGIALFWFTQFTFDSLPKYYGQFNNHFIKDAGLAFLSTGIMLIAAIYHKPSRVILSICGAIFVVLHALFHIQMLLGGMVPAGFISNEMLQVVLPAALLIVVVALIYKTSKS